MSVLTAAIALVAEDAWGADDGGLRLLLPVPGDLRGVPEATRALPTGVALWRLAHDGAGHLGIPVVEADGLRWHWREAGGTPVPVHLSEARRTLRVAILECARELADLEVARDDGGRIAVEEAEDALAPLRLPSAMPAEQVRLLREAVRLRAAATWALGSVGGAASASSAELRRVALVRLERAARETLEAALRPTG